MNELNKTKFQIVVDKDPKGLWSFGMFICHFDDQTYILFNLFKISIAIGKLYRNWSKRRNRIWRSTIKIYGYNK